MRYATENMASQAEVVEEEVLATCKDDKNQRKHFMGNQYFIVRNNNNSKLKKCHV